MTERPISFSGEMVRAVLEGRKTQTRRIVKVQPEKQAEGWLWRDKGLDAGYCHTDVPAMERLMEPLCPYGTPGDKLWVREAFRLSTAMNDHPPRAACAQSPIWFEADGSKRNAAGDAIAGRYRHARFMPRSVCRLLLEVSGVRVERLQAISEEDAKAEGIFLPGSHSLFCTDRKTGANGGTTAGESFRLLWDSINAERAPWHSNPWVWAVTFKRLKDTVA